MPQPLTKWEVTTPATDYPVTLEAVKRHLRIDGNDEDDDIELLIAAATDYAESMLEASLMSQTITAAFNAEDVEFTPPVRDNPADGFGRAGPIAAHAGTWGTAGRSLSVKLPRGPVSAVVSVADANGAAVAGCELERTPAGDRLRLTRAVTAYPFVVTYTAGHASAAAIPATIRVAIRAHVGTLYERRESVSQKAAVAVPHSLESFYRLKRRTSGAG